MLCLKSIKLTSNALRQIIASVNSVTYSLSKYLSSLLKPLLCTISGSHIINSTDFVEKVRGIDLTDKVSTIMRDNFFEGLYSQKIKTLKNFKIKSKENKISH